MMATWKGYIEFNPMQSTTAPKKCKATGYGLAEGAFAQITTVPILNRTKQTWVRAGKSDVVDSGTKAFVSE